jgi:hypothetical protein
MSLSTSVLRGLEEEVVLYGKRKRREPTCIVGGFLTSPEEEITGGFPALQKRPPKDTMRSLVPHASPVTQ